MIDKLGQRPWLWI